MGYGGEEQLCPEGLYLIYSALSACTGCSSYLQIYRPISAVVARSPRHFCWCKTIWRVRSYSLSTFSVISWQTLRLVLHWYAITLTESWFSEMFISWSSFLKS